MFSEGSFSIAQRVGNNTKRTSISLCRTSSLKGMGRGKVSWIKEDGRNTVGEPYIKASQYNNKIQ